jgi:hypothetical protein
MTNCAAYTVVMVVTKRYNEVLMMHHPMNMMHMMHLLLRQVLMYSLMLNLDATIDHMLTILDMQIMKHLH